MDALLGKRTDAQVALLLGVGRATVAVRRRELGIPRQQANGKTASQVSSDPRNVWTDHNTSLLGTASDSTIASLLRLAIKAVREMRESHGIPQYSARHPLHRPWTPDEIALLGKMPDIDIAKKLGVNRSTVQARRVQAGIPKFKHGHPGRQWSDEEDALLGTKPDTEVALLLGVCRTSVRKRRKVLGISIAGKVALRIPAIEG
jgi:hypothetical protein